MNSCKNSWMFWNVPPSRNKPSPSPLLSIEVCWWSINTKPWAKKQSQIVANKIRNWGSGVSLKSYTKYCLKTNKEKEGFCKYRAFILLKLNLRNF